MVESRAAHPASTTAPQTHLWPAYRALVGTGLACALLIVAMYYLTKPIIETKRQAQLEAAIFKVLPGTAQMRDFSLNPDGQLDTASSLQASGAIGLYAGFDMQGELTGIAVRAQGMGYQDTIRVLYGYAPTTQTITGLQVLDSKETPGLGDKIEKDPVFVANFASLDSALTADFQALANPIVAVKHGEKTQPWQIDGITGATISSDAIARILHTSASELLPLIYPQRSAIRALYAQSEDNNGRGEAAQQP